MSEGERHDKVPEEIYAGPTKRFFVSMLTRDIDLKDAILDLLDNCVDGAMRKNREHLGEELPYNGFTAEITISNDRFEIKDNCGGIPADRIEHAFMLGRPDVELDADLPTVGMYGIGMKRSIFKMGRNTHIATKSDTGTFTIHYTPDWLDGENLWDLPINRDENDIEGEGTHIIVEQLLPNVARQFSSETGFTGELKKAISTHYGYIMERGFKVILNDAEIEPVLLRMHAVEVVDAESKAIAPYVFTNRVDDVDIFVSVGFYRPPPKAQDVEDELESSTSSDEAGITVICNDRVVLHNDRSSVTGWGEQGTPKYHNQFSSIAGQVVFNSTNAEKLPLTTTKRGIEINSDAYWNARKYLIEGIKAFTNFTNKWKGVEVETAQDFRATKLETANEFRSRVSGFMKSVRSDANALRFKPNLPTPPEENPFQRVSFRKEKAKIRALSNFLFDDPDKSASEVGEACFEKCHGDIEE